MKQLKVPSIQHLARMSADDPEMVRKGLVRLFDNPPRSSYRLIEQLMPDLLLFDQPLEDLERAVRMKERRPYFQDDFIEILHLCAEHFDGVKPDYVDAVTTRFYSAGRGLMIPFRPPVFWGLAGETALPWFSYWKRNPLSGTKLSLFVTLVRDILSEDPDLDEARLDLVPRRRLELPRPCGHRYLKPARLPIPPPGQGEPAVSASRRGMSTAKNAQSGVECVGASGSVRYTDP